MALAGTCHINRHITPLPARRRGSLIVAAAKKGQRAKPQKPKRSKKFKGSAGSNTAKNQKFIEDESRPQTPQERMMSAKSLGTSAPAQQSERPEDPEFEARLRRLAAQTPQVQQQQESQPEAPVDILAMKPAEYVPPKPVRTAPKKADEGGSPLFGQAAAGLGAVILMAIFLITSFGGGGGGGDLDDELSQAERKVVEGQAQKYVEKLKTTPGSPEALEGAAVAYTKLGDVKKATGYLESLVRVKPDREVYRLLAESQAVQNDYSAAVNTYKTVIASTGGKDLDLVSGYADVLVDDGKPQQAVDAVKEARDTSGDDEDLAFNLDLVRARILTRWKGHDGEALALLDTLAERRPDDFRVPLAKGLLLKGEGRNGDAQRSFMKARFLAPATSRDALERIIATTKL